MALWQVSKNSNLNFQEAIQDYPYSERDAYYCILYKWTCGLLLAKTSNFAVGVAQMQKAVHILRALDCQQSADYYQENLNEFLAK